jgi:RNA-directed DNA polymerase
MESSLCEKPERHAPRRLSDHLGLEGLKQKVHSLVDKVYSRANLMLAWERSSQPGEWRRGWDQYRGF